MNESYRNQDHRMCWRPATLRDLPRFSPSMVVVVVVAPASSPSPLPSLVASAAPCCLVACCVAFLPRRVSFRFWLQLISIFGPLRRPRVRRPPTVIFNVCGPFICCRRVLAQVSSAFQLQFAAGVTDVDIASAAVHSITIICLCREWT